MRKPIIYLVGFLAFLTSCQNFVSNTIKDFDQEIELKFGEKINFQEEGISIQFSDVVDDSRCPIEFSCFWAGNAEVVVHLNNNKINLNSNIDPKQANISNFTIKLISVEPYPINDTEIQDEEYSVKLQINNQ